MAFLSAHQKCNLILKSLCQLQQMLLLGMFGSQNGFVSLLEKHVKEIGNKHDILKCYCIIHQEALCSKSAGFANVMKVVVKVVNFILFRVINHRQFQDLLAKINSQYTFFISLFLFIFCDLLYLCEVRWMSRGKMLERVFNLTEKIATFLEEKKLGDPKFRNAEWDSKLAFLTDITSHA